MEIIKSLANKRLEDYKRFNDASDYDSLMEEIFSFRPRVRKDKIKNSRELRIQNNSAKKLYNKRVSISKDIVKGEYDDIVKDTAQALLYNKLSPEIYEGWTNYIKNISMREGGWDYVKSTLSKEIDAIESANNNMCQTIFFAFLILLVSAIARAPMIVYGLDALNISVFLISSIIFIAYLIFFTIPSIEVKRAARTYFVGNDKKKVDTFVKYEQAVLGSW